MLFKSKKVIGLDIGTSTIKVAELEVSRKRAVLNGFSISPTPAGAVASGDIAEITAVAEEVARLVRELKTKRTMVSAGIWGNSVIIKKISIPRVEERLVGEQMRWEAEQYIPFDIDSVNLDFAILKTSQSPESMDVLLIAARQESVMKYLEVVEATGLKLSVVDVAGFAFANCFFTNYPESSQQTVALLNVGATATNMVVVEKGEVVFCRDIFVGGASYTNEIQKALNISAKESEAMKLAHTAGQATPEEVANLIAATHEFVTEEIRGSFDFFLNTHQGAPISQCFVTGGGVKTPGLLESLGKTIKIPCHHFDPFKEISFNQKVFTPEYLSQISDFCAVAMGLGLRSNGDSR